MSRKTYDYLFKLVLVGNAGVGKTGLLERFTDNSFSSSYIPTIGVDFRIRTVRLNGKVIKLQVWDTSGQERFKTIITAFMRGSAGIMVVYDVTNEKSFTSLPSWLSAIEENAKSDVKKLLVGCKCELEDERVVDYLTAKNFSEHVQIPLCEVSVRDSQVYVENAIMTLVTEILEETERHTSPSSDQESEHNSRCCVN